MDLKIVNKDIEFYTDVDGFLELKTVTGTEEIVQRIEKIVSMDLGTHRPRKNNGVPWSDLFSGEKTVGVIESRIYEELKNDRDLDQNSLQVKINFNGRTIEITIDVMTKTGEEINVKKTGGA